MNPSILLVTWFVASQPPQSYQVRVADCPAARAALLEEAEKLRGTVKVPAPSSSFQIVAPSKPEPVIPASQYPKVSAICVEAELPGTVQWQAEQHQSSR
jgi:hypothetical protein